ncbi:hypothetical protein [Nocardia amamiensis]|uniref:hypothetical protein n=1 Tax=Nocardia amamiensis TaxID=404578 RepID=UPI00082A3683|nr:hypothetical protein [Nocardia amamiensis]
MIGVVLPTTVLDIRGHAAAPAHGEFPKKLVAAVMTDATALGVAVVSARIGFGATGWMDGCIISYSIGSAHAQGGVALAVVEDLEVLQDRVGQLDPPPPALPVQ